MAFFLFYLILLETLKRFERALSVCREAWYYFTNKDQTDLIY